MYILSIVLLENKYV